MGTDVPIIIDDDMCKSQGAMGLYIHGNIVLQKEYPSQIDFVDTLTHECFHALSGILGTQLDSHLEEILANTVGQMNVKLINAMFKAGVFNENVRQPKDA